MVSKLWPYVTPGIPDHLFERLPGIPMSKRENRLLLLSQLQLRPDSIFWDIGAGTGTICIEAALLCPQGQVIALERDAEVAGLIRCNCDRFIVPNIQVVEGNAPEHLEFLPHQPDRICVEGGKPLRETLKAAWQYLQNPGRLVATANSFEHLYAISESLSELRGRNIEVVQSAVNRLETRGGRQAFIAVDPMFVLSAEKLD